MSDNMRMLQRPFFYDYALDGNTIYFSMASYNALCRGDLTNDQVEILGTFPDIPEHKGLAYYGIYRFKEYLLLAPNDNTDDFLIYDIKCAKFSKLHNKGKINFYSSAVCEKNNILYIVSKKTAEINKINLQNFSVKCLSCKEYILDNALIAEMVKVDNLIYIPLNQKKIMLTFDIDKEEFTHCEYPANISFIASICYHDGKFWTTGKDRKIYAWRLNETEACEVAEFPDYVKLFYEGSSWFVNSFIHRDALWLFPHESDLILKYNLLTKQIEKVEITGEEESVDKLEEELKNGRYFASKYNIVQKHGNNVFFRSSKTRILYELDLVTNNIHKHDLKVNNIYNGQIYPPVSGIMTESFYLYGLEILMRSLKRDVENIEVINEKMVGEDIYKYISG